MPSALITQRSQVQILPPLPEVRGQRPDRRKRRSGLLAACWRFVGGTGPASAAPGAPDRERTASGAGAGTHGRAGFSPRGMPRVLWRGSLPLSSLHNAASASIAAACCAASLRRSHALLQRFPSGPAQTVSHRLPWPWRAVWVRRPSARTGRFRAASRRMGRAARGERADPVPSVHDRLAIPRAQPVVARPARAGRGRDRRGQARGKPGVLRAGRRLRAQHGRAVALPDRLRGAALPAGRLRTARHPRRRRGGLGIRPPCLIKGEQFIPIAFYAGCASAPGVASALAAGSRVAVLEPSGSHPPGYARRWVQYRLPGSGVLRVTAYLPGAASSACARLAGAGRCLCLSLICGSSYLVKAGEDDIQLPRAVKVLKDGVVECALHYLRHGIRGVETDVGGTEEIARKPA